MSFNSASTPTHYLGPSIENCPHCARVGRGMIPFIPVWHSDNEVIWLCKNWYRCPFPYIDGPDAVKRQTVPLHTVDPSLLGTIPNVENGTAEIVAPQDQMHETTSRIPTPSTSTSSPANAAIGHRKRPLTNKQASKTTFPGYASQNDPNAESATSSTNTSRDPKADVMLKVAKKIQNMRRGDQ